MNKNQFPTEVISLPSEGRCYPESNPLSAGTLEIKYMTAREEEILASTNLIKKGIVLDKLFESIIVDKDVNPDDILIGDKNAIMLATRILGYGHEYKIEMEDEMENKNEVVVDLRTVQTKDIDMSILNRQNRYTFTTPTTKNVIEYKLLTHGDEKQIDTEIKALQKMNKDASFELTTRYRFMITSVDGNGEMGYITNFINNGFLTKDTKAFREHIKKMSPDVKMEFEYENPDSGEKEVRSIPMGVGFFWPSE
jgi:hypothetical protein